MFIGSGTSINYNVQIGSNVIIGACSLITKDVPDNCVVGGVPAKIISSFEEYLEKRDKFYIKNEKFGLELLDDKVCQTLWNDFYLQRN